MTKADLAEKIKRRLGYPMIKVELDSTQIYDAIDTARNKFIKWAVGQATQETFITVMLSGGQHLYDLPIGVTEVVSYEDREGSYGDINTLFTVDNFLYNQGMFDTLLNTTGDNYSIITYHIARDFLETVQKYTPSKYNYKYHRYTNQIEIHPAPPVSGSSLNVTNSNGDIITVDSPGWILLRTFMIEGSSYENWQSGDTDNNFYESDWIFDYALAESKIMLGRIRSKFAQFASIGNAGIALDGSELISEGISEKTELKETLKLEESFEGFPIMIG
jgi:hypothetical protein